MNNITIEHKSPGIYAIVNKITNTIYIGSSNNIYARTFTHQQHLNSNTHENPYLQNAWNKYSSGKENFTAWVLEESESGDAALITEQYYLDTWPTKELYNINQKADRPPISCSKYPELRGPDGTVYEAGENISKFEKEHGLCANTIAQLITGKIKHRKGWCLNSTPQSEILIRKAKPKKEIKNHIQSLAIKEALRIRREENPNKIYGSAKPYPSLTAPDGTIYPGGMSLRAFCTLHNINYKAIGELVRDITKESVCRGWKVTGRVVPPKEEKAPSKKSLEKITKEKKEQLEIYTKTKKEKEIVDRKELYKTLGIKAKTKEYGRKEHTRNPEFAVPYAIIDPEGNLHEGTDYAKFCKENELNKRGFDRVRFGYRNSYHGWRLKDPVPLNPNRHKRNIRKS
jgi:group I intron endonuclease